MKFEVWSNGDRSVGIPGGSAHVTIDGLETWGSDWVETTVEILEDAFANIFDDTPVYVISADEARGGPGMNDFIVRYIKKELKDQISEVANNLKENGMVDVDAVAYEVARRNGELRQLSVGKHQEPPPVLVEVVAAVLEVEW